ncbi:MAG: 16S rRNA (cytosine(967)-C(5))-methyltransferase RsmB [Rhizobacter sp.]|nr:16S rRNA (cytosine(967)-C(5))-methyltransferase RsmB [Chlorobiales bacterium]
MKAREVAVKALRDIEQGSAKSDTVLNRYFLTESLENIDKAFIMQVVYGTLREKMKIDHVISQFYKHDFRKMDEDVKNILRIGVYQLLYLTRVPKWAAVNESVELAKLIKSQFLGNLVNGVLRNIANSPDEIDYRVKGGTFADQLALKHSHPRWLLERWFKVLGFAEAEQLMEANNRTPKISFRINRLKSEPEPFFETLLAKKVLVERSVLEGFFTPERFFDIKPWLDQGSVSVQSESQGMACRLLAPKPGNRVLDMCAAPGGKATHLAELMQNTGKITAIDLYDNKLADITALSTALGVSVIETAKRDARTFQPEEKYDLVLLDAPCTGTGVIGRRAELRWRLTPKSIPEMCNLQSELLTNAATCVKDGGAMVYSTCSLEPEENDEQVDAFLKSHDGWTVQNAKEVLPEVLHTFVNERGAVQVWPHRHNMDGAYSVRLTKP